MPVITIDGPWNLAHRDTLRGRYFDCAPTTRLQVLVLSSDGKWYPQAQVRKLSDGFTWECDTVLGFDTYLHPIYGVAAGIGGKKVYTPQANLPTDVLWVRSSVVRSDGLGDN